MWYPWILFYIRIVMVNRLSWTHNLQHQPNPTVALWGFCELHFRQNTSHYILFHEISILIMHSVHFLRSTLMCEFHKCTTLHISPRIRDIWKVRKCATCDQIEFEILVKLRGSKHLEMCDTLCVCEESITEVASGVAEIESHQNMLTSPAKAQG